MPHRFRIDGRTLYTWCAWDSLFIPVILHREAEVESLAPGSTARVRLRVAADRVKDVQPPSAVGVRRLRARPPDDQHTMASGGGREGPSCTSRTTFTRLIRSPTLSLHNSCHQSDRAALQKHKRLATLPFLRRRSQVVRRRSAKPLYVGSIPTGASQVRRSVACPRRFPPPATNTWPSGWTALAISISWRSRWVSAGAAPERSGP